MTLSQDRFRHRFRFYNAPRIELAIPDEVRIGKFAEVYLKAYEDRTFFERKFNKFYTYLTLFLNSIANTKRQ